MLKSRFIFTLVVSLFSIAANATASSDLSGLLKGIRSMKADFTQTIFDNRDKPIQKSYGNMALVRPGKFLWQTTKPIPQLIIANDSRLWIYDPDLEQVTIRALHKATGESPALLLSHEDAEIDHDYTVKTISKKAGKWFVLIPRGEDSVFEQVEMGFNGAELTEMRLQDHIGHHTQILFKHTQTNVNIPASLFTFKKTANIDVIDETKHKR